MPSIRDLLYSDKLIFKNKYVPWLVKIVFHQDENAGYYVVKHKKITFNYYGSIIKVPLEQFQDNSCTIIFLNPITYFEKLYDMVNVGDKPYTFLLNSQGIHMLLNDQKLGHIDIESGEVSADVRLVSYPKHIKIMKI